VIFCVGFVIFCVGFVIFCILRLPEGGTLMPKHVDTILSTNCVVRFVICCILYCASVGQYTEITLYISLMSGSQLCFGR
jgi:hypothetical protein